jgi:hypothetical protein
MTPQAITSTSRPRKRRANASTPTSRCPRVLPIVLAVSCAVAIGACGSSGKPSSAAASNGYAQGIKGADCMRSHGVPNFPDPSAGGGFQLGANPGFNPQSPAFQSAQKACAKLLPGDGGPPPMSESQRLAAIAFAKCMRKHGLPNFPDPTLASTSGPTLVLRGIAFGAGLGLNPQSPAFKHAAAACGIRLH